MLNRCCTAPPARQSKHLLEGTDEAFRTCPTFATRRPDRPEPQTPFPRSGNHCFQGSACPESSWCAESFSSVQLPKFRARQVLSIALDAPPGGRIAATIRFRVRRGASETLEQPDPG